MNSVEQAAEMLSDREVDILVNNTGGPPGGPAIDAKPAAFFEAFQQHLIANQLITKAVVHNMVEKQSGRIINVISTSVKQPIKGLGVSNTVRGAVANWSKTLAAELGSNQITVNNVLPGATSTERLSSIIQAKSNKTGTAEDTVSASMQAAVPMNRFAQPEEIGNAILFLASDLASYINGTNVVVDGGRTACL
jgi:3-oxoacyl-[acyl-carrier protein] reductase